MGSKTGSNKPDVTSSWDFQPSRKPKVKQRIKLRHKPKVQSSFSEYLLPKHTQVKLIDNSYSVECIYNSYDFSEKISPAVVRRKTVEKSTQTESDNGVLRSSRVKKCSAPVRPSSCFVVGSSRLFNTEISRRSFPRGTLSNASSHSDVFLQFPDYADETDSSSLSSP